MYQRVKNLIQKDSISIYFCDFIRYIWQYEAKKKYIYIYFGKYRIMCVFFNIIVGTYDHEFTNDFFMSIVTADDYSFIAEFFFHAMMVCTRRKK